jgi:hypothetical protein
MAILMPLYDRCNLGTQAATTFGEPRAAYTYSGTSTRCLVINPAPGEDPHGLQLPIGAVKIAFRMDSGVKADTRIRVTRRLRKTLATPEDYTVTGDPRMIRGRLVATCKQTNNRDSA